MQHAHAHTGVHLYARLNKILELEGQQTVIHAASNVKQNSDLCSNICFGLSFLHAWWNAPIHPAAGSTTVLRIQKL